MFSAYVINNEIVSPDEWFATKDIVELDGDELRFLKRSDKMVKILGELVDLDGLENELNLESEEQVVLIDIPNERRGREIVPVLEHEPSSKRKELLSSLNGLHLLREPVIKKFPRSDLGKIMRAKLREQIVE